MLVVSLSLELCPPHSELESLSDPARSTRLRVPRGDRKRLHLLVLYVSLKITIVLTIGTVALYTYLGFAYFVVWKA